MAIGLSEINPRHGNLYHTTTDRTWYDLQVMEKDDDRTVGLERQRESRQWRDGEKVRRGEERRRGQLEGLKKGAQKVMKERKFASSSGWRKSFSGFKYL